MISQKLLIKCKFLECLFVPPLGSLTTYNKQHSNLLEVTFKRLHSYELKLRNL